jgi:hypothetical protein
MGPVVSVSVSISIVLTSLCSTSKGMYLITVSAAKLKTIIKSVIKIRIPPLKMKNSLSG